MIDVTDLYLYVRNTAPRTAAGTDYYHGGYYIVGSTLV